MLTSSVSAHVHVIENFGVVFPKIGLSVAAAAAAAVRRVFLGVLYVYKWL